MADKDFKVKSGLDLGTPLPLTEGGTGQTSADNALNALLPLQTSSANKVLQTNGTTTSWVTLPNGYSKGNTASRPGSPSLGDIYSNTETGYIEVYTSAGWSQLGVIPLSATIGTSTDVGTNRAYNNGAVSVTFTPNAGGGLASSYTATSTSGGYSASGSSSPIVVTDIPVGTSTTFTVTATNGYGNALASSASNSATTTTLPQAPTIGTATATTGIAYGSTPTASLTFTAGATGGKTISNYKYSTDGTTYTAFSPSQTTSPLTVSGLASGTLYNFRLKSVNANGDSLATSVSNSVTAATVPQAPTIGTATVTNATTISIPFTAGNNGGSSITSYTVTSSPSISLSTSSTSSPLSVTGAFAANTSYSFTIVANNAYGASTASVASNSITPILAYALSQTFNASGNYTVPAGKTSMAIVGIGAGGGGGTGGAEETDISAGGGGGSGGVVILREITVTPGNIYSITIGSQGNGGSGNTGGNTGGNTTFGNILTLNGASGGAASSGGRLGGSGGNVSFNTGTADVSSSGKSGGTGSYGYSDGGSGTAQLTINSNDANISSYLQGGSGGGGGGGFGGSFNTVAPGPAGSPFQKSGGIGGTPDGGAGGVGGSMNSQNTMGPAGNGSSANVYGGGGGGGGGVTYNNNVSFGNSTRTNGGAGSGAQILVYVK